MKFKELNLPEFVLNALDKLGFEDATEIQEKAIPLIMSKADVIGKSKTGSGKTFAYGIPAIQSIDINDRRTQALVVSPTRELASQICEELRKITSEKPGYRVVPIFGGSDMSRQIKALKEGAKIVVGTPGRLIDHINRRTLKLNNVKMLVLDEADEMLDMGFKDDIETILSACNMERQTIMFSATMPPAILSIAQNYMKNPEMIEITGVDSLVDIKEKFVYVNSRNKLDALVDLLVDNKPNLSIVFSNTKKMVEQIVTGLNEYGFNAIGLHGDMRQSARKNVMKDIRAIKLGEEVNGKINILVATDVAARGIDISGVDIVFNFDIPNDYDYYTHRIGRTGRAKKSGVAISIVGTPNQLRELMEISKTRNLPIEEISCAHTKVKVNENLFKDVKLSSNSKSNARNSRTHRGSGDFASRQKRREKSNADNSRFDKKKNYERKPFAKDKTNFSNEENSMRGKSSFNGKTLDKTSKFVEKKFDRDKKSRFNEEKKFGRDKKTNWKDDSVALKDSKFGTRRDRTKDSRFSHKKQDENAFNKSKEVSTDKKHFRKFDENKTSDKKKFSFNSSKVSSKKISYRNDKKSK